MKCFNYYFLIKKTFKAKFLFRHKTDKVYGLDVICKIIQNDIICYAFLSLD